MSNTRSLRLSVRAIAATVVILVPALASAQSMQGNNARVTPVMTAGCSGLAWSRTASTQGVGLPVVQFVDDKSPADQSGLKAGDVVLAVNGKDVREMEDTWFNASPGTKVTLRVQRGTKVSDVVVVAGRAIDFAPVKFEMRCTAATE